MNNESTFHTAIWVDFGGVLVPFGPETVENFCRRVGVPSEMVIEAMVAVARAHGTDDVMEPLDTPLVSGEEWAVRMTDHIRERYGVEADLSNFAGKWFEGRPVNQELVDVLRELRRDHFVGLLSNMVPAFNPYWRALTPPDELFDDVVLSYEVGFRKPRSEIFDLAARRAGAPSAACVLVDDLEENCVAARAAGWQAVRFVDTADAIERIQELVGGAARV